MQIRAPILLSLLLIAGMAAVSAWAWAQLGADARIATHFGFDGHANGWMRRDRALLLAPVMGAILTLAFALLPKFTKQKEGLAASFGSYVTAWIGSLTVLFVAHCAIVLAARGWKVDIAGSTVVVVDLMFIVLGNGLGKSRPNPWVGVRTPWTKKSDQAWDKANRAAGRMIVATGLASLAALAAAGDWAAHLVLFAGIVVMAVVSTALSYLTWKRDPDRRE
jgi:uncharacterized membrane protein